jgi:hypothetical protein
VRPRDVILLLVSLYAALASIRMMPLFVLIAVPLISKRLGSWPLQSHHPRHPRFPRVLFNTAIVVAMVVFAVIRVAQVVQRQPAAESRQFPVGAVAFLQAHPPSGPIFNHYDWGGYLIWKLAPSTPVFIDGRADLYGSEMLHDFADAYQLKGPWRQILRRWRIRTAILPQDSALAVCLRAAPGWTVSFQDSQSIVLTAPP